MAVTGQARFDYVLLMEERGWRIADIIESCGNLAGGWVAMGDGAII